MGAHVAAGDLVRWADEGAASTDPASLGHLRGCAACTGEWERVQRRSARLRRLLAAGDHPGRVIARATARPGCSAARRGTGQAWRVAAAVGALLVGSHAAPPLWAWLAKSAAEAFGPRPDAAAIGAPNTAPADSGATVTFTPTTRALTIVVASRQRAGALQVEVVPGGSVSATGERDAAELVVLPDAIRIHNRRGSAATYLVRVPVVAGGIVVRIGHEAPRTVSAESAGTRWSVSLGPRSAP